MQDVLQAADLGDPLRPGDGTGQCAASPDGVAAPGPAAEARRVLAPQGCAVQ
jgi:hypothetical protein